MKKTLIAYLLLLFAATTEVVAQGCIDSVALRAMQVGRGMQQERVYLHFDNSGYYLTDYRSYCRTLDSKRGHTEKTENKDRVENYVGDSS
mgnify:CR=1 FL=1